jgi:hypothetical protein
VRGGAWKARKPLRQTVHGHLEFFPIEQWHCRSPEMLNVSMQFFIAKPPSLCYICNKAFWNGEFALAVLCHLLHVAVSGN